jgi:hypothetical protein
MSEADVDEVVVAVRVTGDDFERMTVQRSRWRDKWRPEDDFGDRFFPVPYNPAETVSYSWHCAYWYITWGDVVLARSFLEARKQPHQIISDEHEGQYVILTDYSGTKPDFFLTKAEQGATQ